MIRWLIPVLAALSVGCQPTFVKSTSDEDSPYFEIPVGSKFVLQSEILVPPLTERLYFQDGNLPAWYNVNKHRPYCVLQLDAARDQVEVIKPAEFVVTKIATAHLFKLAEASEASADMQPAATGSAEDKSGSEDHDDYETFGSVMQLHAGRTGRQQHVARLTCTDWGLPQPGMHVTVRKIQQALGGYFRLDVASK